MLTRLLTLQFTITGCARLLKVKALARDMLLAPTDQNDNIARPSDLGPFLAGVAKSLFSNFFGPVVPAARP